VLASLWSVSDASTAELMRRFYGHLRAGLAKDQALRAAQLELLRGPVEVTENGRTVKRDVSHPFHWAAFEVIGDWK
jgi:CHAT domain-containing protein